MVAACLALGLLGAAALPAKAVGSDGGGIVKAPAATSSASVLSQPVHFVEITGATLGYRVAGTGTPLVLIAGSSNTMAEWDPALLDGLARDHRVIIFDNRGAGTSTGSVDHLTIALMAHDTEQLIARIAHGRADVLGWSMGGYIAQKLAIAYPQRVRRLVLASTDCGGSRTLPPKPWALSILMDPDATQEQRLTVLFPKDRLDVGGAWAAALGAAYAADGYQPANAFTVSPETMQAQARAAGPLWLRHGGGTCSHLDRIRQRVLIGAGRRDVIVPVADHLPLLHGIPNSKAMVFDDAGHAFLFQPELGFTKTVSAFLRAP